MVSAMSEADRVVSVSGQAIIVLHRWRTSRELIMLLASMNRGLIASARVDGGDPGDEDAS